MSGVNSEETVGGPNACHRVRVSSRNIYLGCVFQAWRLVAAGFCLGLSLGMGVGTLSSWSHPENTQNLFIPQQISVGSQLRLSAIVGYTLAIIGCLFHLEKPSPPPPRIKESSTPVSAPIKSFTCPDGASAIAAPPPRSHSLALFTAPPQRSGSHFLVLCLCHRSQRRRWLPALLPHDRRSFPSLGFVPRFPLFFLSLCSVF